MKKFKIAMYLIVPTRAEDAWQVYTCADNNPAIRVADMHAMKTIKGSSGRFISELFETIKAERPKQYSRHYLYVSENFYGKNISYLSFGYDLTMFFRIEGNEVVLASCVIPEYNTSA
jgi:hypothetical protein